MSNPVARVLTAAQMGAVGAFVGAVLSAFTEPMVNRILVQRITLGETLARFSFKESLKFFEAGFFFLMLERPHVPTLKI